MLASWGWCLFSLFVALRRSIPFLYWGDGVFRRGDRHLDLLDWCPVWLGGISGLVLDRWWWSLSWCLELIAVCLLSIVSDHGVWSFWLGVSSCPLCCFHCHHQCLLVVASWRSFGGCFGSLYASGFRCFSVVFCFQGYFPDGCSLPVVLLTCGFSVCLIVWRCVGLLWEVHWSFLVEESTRSSSVEITSSVEPADRWWHFCCFSGGVGVFSFSLFFIVLLLYVTV